jgi:hypothetical protein
MEKRIFNKTDTAEYFGVNRRTILNWQKAGFGPRFTASPGGREYTTRQSCDEFLAEIKASADSE